MVQYPRVFFVLIRAGCFMPVIISCPSCEKSLQVPEEFFGKMVQCPECKTMFQAQPRTEPTTPPPPDPTSLMPARSAPARSTPAPRPPEDFEDEDDAPIRRRGIRRRDSDLAPDRGSTILTLGIISLAGGLFMCLPFLIGPIPWMMASHDLAEMRAERMNPEGKSNTEIGQMLGIISTVIGCLFLLGFCGIFGLIALAANR